MISASKVARPTKEMLARDIANVLGLSNPAMSSGSTVVSAFLDEVHKALVGSPTGGADTYRKIEQLLHILGLTYDPYWDSSESAQAGGGTVTVRAYSRIRSALTNTPRCFILNTTDAPVGARWETDRESTYRYDTTVTGRASFNDAGPGTKVVYYSTSNSSTNKMQFVAFAEVRYVAPGWEGPWTAELTGYTALPTPVPVDQVRIEGWNRQHSLTEIDWNTYTAILHAGGSGIDHAPRTFDDPGGEVVAERVIHDFPPPAVSAPPLHVPDELPTTTLTLQEPRTPQYQETADGDDAPVGQGPPTRNTSNSKKDKLAEQRAVELTVSGLAADGWKRTRDRQKDGVGYDLEFAKEARRLNVEVKGIQGSKLAFNLTPKETWRAETDPAWILIAVTSVLSPTAYQLHLLTRAQIAAAARTIIGYRLTVAN